MNYIKILIIFFGIIGCEKTESNAIEKRIAEKIANHVIENDSLNENIYSRKVLLHIKSEKLNDKNYKTYVSLNSQNSNLSESETEKLSINGFETIIYYSKSKSIFDLPEPFWIPDTKSWSFSSEIIENDIMISEQESVISNDENGADELNKIDF